MLLDASMQRSSPSSNPLIGEEEGGEARVEGQNLGRGVEKGDFESSKNSKVDSSLHSICYPRTGLILFCSHVMMWRSRASTHSAQYVNFSILIILAMLETHHNVSGM